MARGILGLAILATALLLSVGCNQIIQNPVPVVNSLAPKATTAGSSTFTLTVNGSNFVFGGYVIWNGLVVSTRFINSNQLQATIAPSQLNQPGPVPILVFNPAPGGGNSNQVDFTVNPAVSPIPAASSLQPTAAQVDGTGFTLTINGSSFTPTSIVTWSGVNVQTTYINNTELQAVIPSTDLQDPGIVQVAVLNPSPGGGLSNALSFLVNNVTPSISSITPTSAMAGAAGFTFTVNGKGFACQDLTTTTTTTNGVTSSTTTCPQSASVIEWNGSALSTTYVNASQLTANVSTAQLTEAGTAFVTVFNPPPGGGSSANAFFQVIPGPNGQGLPALVDVSSDGAQANSGIGNLGNSGPVIAGGGRFIAFSSVSQNLVSNLANGVASVFLRDTCLGISSGCSPQTILVSQANDGEAANAAALQPSISSDGRYVVFSSAATNLAAGAVSSTQEIYLRDTCLGAPSGCSPSTTLVSVGTNGAPANGSSTQPYISPDASYIAFVSTADLVSASTPVGTPEIYLRSTCLNVTSACTPTTTLVSVAANGTAAYGTNASPVVSSGGRYVAFQSNASGLVNGISTSLTQQLYWRDTCIGASPSCTPLTSLVSIDSGGTGPGNAPSGEPSMSSDGRYVVFSSQASNLMVGPGFVSGIPQQIYERDMCAGASSCTPSTILVSVATDGSSLANALAEHPQTDQTGRYVLFASPASNLVSTTPNNFEQIYARDTCLGATSCTPRTALISVAADGTTIGNGNSLYPAIATQAHFGAFLSFASNIVSDDTTPNLEDIFLSVTTF